MTIVLKIVSKHNPKQKFYFSCLLHYLLYKNVDFAICLLFWVSLEYIKAKQVSFFELINYKDKEFIKNWISILIFNKTFKLWK